MDVNKKILWISDFDLDKAPGGAQRSDKIIIDKGRILGFNILKVNKDTLKNIESFDPFDIIVTSNITGVYYTYPNILEKISNHKYHVRIEHDSNEYFKQEDRIKLFGSCKKTFFLSDYHLHFFEKLYGDIFKNTEIVLDPIDSDQFHNMGLERSDEILYSGYLHEGKGANIFFQYVIKNPDKRFAVSGWSSAEIYRMLAENLPNVRFLGRTEYEDMPKLYNNYKHMFYVPVVREPFCRSVAEAILCGTRVMGDNNNPQIGCLFELNKLGFDEFKKQCKEAPETFWSKI